MSAEIGLTLSTPRLSRQNPVIRSNQSCFGQINHVRVDVIDSQIQKRKAWALRQHSCNCSISADLIARKIQLMQCWVLRQHSTPCSLSADLIFFKA
jgi:hypothetical protein